MKEASVAYIPIIEGIVEDLETNGWHQGSLYGPDRSACLVGAATRVLQRMGLIDSPGVAAPVKFQVFAAQFDSWSTEFLCEYTDRRHCTIPNFNDSPYTTYEDVILFLKRAIAECSDAGS